MAPQEGSGHGGNLKADLVDLKPLGVITADEADHNGEVYGNKPCTKNTDCKEPQVCNAEGVCMMAPEDGGSVLSADEVYGNKPCSKNTDCKEPQVCNADGVCMMAPTVAPKLMAHAMKLKPMISADGKGYECETKYDCADPQICNEYGICELAPRSAEDARSRSKSKSSSRRSGSKSSSRRSGSGSGSGSRSYDGHGSAELSADGIGYECETKYDCADPQICNENGICELAPRSAE